MGEKENKPFQLTFNGFLKVDFQGSRVTSDGGLILVRELDERLGLGKLIDEHLSDSRQGLNKKFALARARINSFWLQKGFAGSSVGRSAVQSAQSTSVSGRTSPGAYRRR